MGKVTQDCLVGNITISMRKRYDMLSIRVMSWWKEKIWRWKTDGVEVLLNIFVDTTERQGRAFVKLFALDSSCGTYLRRYSVVK